MTSLCYGELRAALIRCGFADSKVIESDDGAFRILDLSPARRSHMASELAELHIDTRIDGDAVVASRA
jgi:hypothetical protein